ncbi:hypothetical protein QTP70_000234 [Hemibagrus guttatus]|uniref:Uncharacterized protein n=1 Tax=Hemibagrus guttatus TaxID=175788 RepID=A0AAE0R0E1_9TELE|nr:hypothetical protein QTP70_000234 [Hemibagrus guttatus]KAK3565143.1 hypothetical protein QTP86_000248 [Hemibagrus guttatus]
MTGVGADLETGDEHTDTHGGNTRCVPANGVTVEEVLLEIGKEMGYDSISSASRMNKVVVVFVKEESHRNRVGTNTLRKVTQAPEEAPSQGNERATRLGSREKTRQGNKEEAAQGSKEEAVQGSKEEAVQGSKEEGRQEIEEEDGQDGEVKQSTEGDGRLNIEESTITDKVAGEMEGGQGLVDMRSRIRAFGIQAAQRLLYHKDVVWEKNICS